MTLSFISDLALQSHGGGSYFVGYRAHEQLEAGFGNVPYHHIPPDPPWIGGLLWQDFQHELRNDFSDFLS